MEKYKLIYRVQRLLSTSSDHIAVVKNFKYKGLEEAVRKESGLMNTALLTMSSRAELIDAEKLLLNAVT